MNKILIMIFLLVAILAQAQIYTEVNVGEYAITTNSLGTVDKVYPKATRKWYAYTGSGTLIADTVLYVPSSAPNSTIATLMAARPAKKRTAILLQRGSQRDTTITVSKDSIILGSYGTGAKPKIYGSTPITGWTLRNAGGRIYVAKVVSDSTITQLYANDVRCTSARYPDTGNFNATTINSVTQFVSTEINGSLNYTGAICWLEPSEFTMQPKMVTTSSSQTITIESQTGYTFSVGGNFFFTGKYDFITADFEWFHNTTNDSIYVQLPTGKVSADYSFRGTIYRNAIKATTKDYLTIKNLDIRHYLDNAIELIIDCDYATIDNNLISDISRNGIHVDGNNATIRNNTLRDISFVGIANPEFDKTSPAGGAEVGGNAAITDNTLTKIGFWDNLPQYKINFTQSYAIQVGHHLTGFNSVVQHNIIDSIGYIGIAYRGNFNTIQYNYLNDMCFEMTDGGGIYTYAPTSTPLAQYNKIRYNIITNCKGSAGIYMDNYSRDNLIEYNTIAHSTIIPNQDGGRGIFLNTYNQKDTMRYNTIFDCPAGLRMNANTGLTTNIFSNNVLNNPSTTIDYYLANIRDPALIKTGQSPSYLVAMNNNTYIDRKNATPFQNSTGGFYWNFADWKSQTGYDASSTLTTTALGANESEAIVYNTTKSAKTFYLNNATNVADNVTGTAITANFVLQPFTSRLLRGRNTECVGDYDITPPVLTAFSIPATSSTLSTTVSSLTATGGATAYTITETATPPPLYGVTWKALTDLSWTFSRGGSITAYCWVRDVAGNISNSISDGITTVNLLSQGLLLAYDMEETADPLDDESGNGAVATRTEVTYSGANNYTIYDGSNDRFSLANSSFLNFFEDTCTIELNIYPTTFANTPVIFNMPGAFKINLTSSGYLFVTMTDSATSNLSSAFHATAVTLNAWNQYIITYNGSLSQVGIKIYKNNGAESSTQNDNLTITNIKFGILPLTLGGSTGYLNGRIGIVRVWKDKILTAADRTWLYSPGTSGKPTSTF